MKVSKVEAFKVRIPTKGDYKMARGVHRALDTLIVRVFTDTGVVGVGDSHQGVAGYTPETVDTMHAVIENVYGPALLGRDLEPVEAIHVALDESRMGNPFARSALEMALFDALARSQGRNVAAVLGGPVRNRLELSASIGIDEPQKVAELAKQYVDAGYTTVKVKVGTDDVRGDIARVRAAREAVGDSVRIRVDANAGYSLPDAQRFLHGVGELGLEHVEQPVARENIEGMVHLRRLGAAPIMADESVVTPYDAQRFVAAGAGDAIKIKLTKVGGYINARSIISICESAGITLVIGQGLCSSLEAAGEAQLACAFSHVWPVAEMVGPSKLSDDLAVQPVDISSGVLPLPDGEGIGVELSDDKLARFDVTQAASSAKVGAWV